MSESTNINNGPLSETERVDIRRHCGYPAYGAGSSGFQSWRFFDAYGTLEFRLTNLAPEELQVVRQYLNDLAAIEQSVPSTVGNLDTDEAAIWKRNRNEIGDRLRLLDTWRKRLTSFIGVPPGPGLHAVTSIVI